MGFLFWNSDWPPQIGPLTHPPTHSKTASGLLEISLRDGIGPRTPPPTFAGSPPETGAWVLTHPRNGPRTPPPTFAGSPPETGAWVLTHPRNDPRPLVPIHLPRPLRDPLREPGLGCLRTRAMTPAHPGSRLRRFRISACAGGLRIGDLKKQKAEGGRELEFSYYVFSDGGRLLISDLGIKKFKGEERKK